MIDFTTFPKFSVYRSASQGLTTAANTKVAFETELWDTANAFNTSTNRFVAPVAGYYRFGWEVDIVSTAAFLGITMLYKNGAEYKRGSRSALTGGGSVGSSGSGEMYMAVGDYAEIYGFGSAGTVSVGNGAITAWFDGEFIGNA